MNTKTKPKTWHKKNNIDEIGWKKKKKKYENTSNNKAFFLNKKSLFITLIFKWLFILSECD